MDCAETAKDAKSILTIWKSVTARSATLCLCGRLAPLSPSLNNFSASKIRQLGASPCSYLLSHGLQYVNPRLLRNNMKKIGDAHERLGRSRFGSIFFVVCHGLISRTHQNCKFALGKPHLLSQKSKLTAGHRLGLSRACCPTLLDERPFMAACRTSALWTRFNDSRPKHC